MVYAIIISDLMMNCYFFLDFTSQLRIKNSLFPGEDDLEGATDALSRLQQTYNIKTSDIVKGRFTYNITSPKLTGRTKCFSKVQFCFWNEPFNRSSLHCILNLFNGSSKP